MFIHNQVNNKNHISKISPKIKTIYPLKMRVNNAYVNKVSNQGQQNLKFYHHTE